jgi:pyruvate,water dikinase
VELRGLGASPGRAEGRVKVVLSFEDFGKFEEGDVLVTRSTDPSYVIIMGKAAAVVTELGGICSHAAIVSRELGIPCVVGVEGATEVLKDGMRVLVDGDEGRVQVLD